MTAISVIIPTYNEEQHVSQILDRLRAADVREVIVVDSQSTDRTWELANAGSARVVSSVPGRGPQMNGGAAVATGNILLFLHADTTLPKGFENEIRNTLQRTNVVAGAFRLHIDAAGRLFRVLEYAINWRARWRCMPYGDQAIFLTADTFRRVGGYPDYPIMEDYELVRRLRRLGRVAIAPAAVTTSARRWLRLGIACTTLINQTCVVCYLIGVSPARIAQWRDRRPRSRSRSMPSEMTNV